MFLEFRLRVLQWANEHHLGRVVFKVTFWGPILGRAHIIATFLFDYPGDPAVRNVGARREDSLYYLPIWDMTFSEFV